MELLKGAPDKRETQTIKTYYDLILKLEIDKLYILAVEYFKDEKLISKGIGLIDACIITATQKSGSKL